MNSKRKADLQRRLSMVSVPKPPAGLSDRIKQDIPNSLGVENDRAQLKKSVTFNLGIAASILVLISSAFVAVSILSRAPMNERAALQQPNIAMVSRGAVAKTAVAIPNAAPPQLRQPVIAPNVPPVAPQRVADMAPPRSVAEQIVLHRDLPASDEEQEKKEKDAKLASGYSYYDGSTPAAPAPAAAANDIRESAHAPAETAAPAAPAVTPAPVAQIATGGAAPTEPQRNVARRAAPAPPVMAPPPAPPPPALADAAASRSRAETITVTASAPAVLQSTEKTLSRIDFVREARAGDLDLNAPRSVFGISVDGNAFEQVKGAIERGERPTHVDVEALVNYFAGAKKRAPSEVSLEAEASPAPINEDGRTVFIRYTIDTAQVALAPHASTPPIATDARVEIEFDPRAVASYRRVGGDAKVDAVESALLKNVSVTAVYAVELQPNVHVRTPLATIQLHYKNVTNGRERTQTRQLRIGDVTRRWSDASRRHRLAALGAVWGEHLKSSTGGADVARRAEELAKQEPKDERAKELAALANASSR